jgi:3-oxoacyl-[acyl-carrier protein] reductase
MNETRPLRGRSAVIIGCASARGFGKAVADRLGDAGAKLMLVDRKEAAAGLEGVGAALAERGIENQIEHADVCRADDMRRVFERTTQAFGGVDIVYFGAAAPLGPDRKPIVELPDEVWDQVIDVNLKGAFLCAKEAGSTMIRQGRGGRIITVSSSLTKIPRKNCGAYAASKAGLQSLTQTLALELASYGITVNTVCPTFSNTGRGDALGMVDGKRDEEAFAKKMAQFRAEIPVGRILEPADIAHVVLFLALPDSSFITGQAINVSGGSIMS